MNVLVLSPHRDDAAFSCGLLLRALVAAKVNPTIVNVCTISDYAPFLEGERTSRAQRVSSARAAEDAAFIDELVVSSYVEGGEVTSIDLGWKDAPLRWQIQEEQVLDPASIRSAEVDALKQSFSELRLCDLAIAPLAIGGHVDHLLVREAAFRAFLPTDLLFYEDLPYACRISESERNTTFIETDVAPYKCWSPTVSSAKGLKMKYASCYPSQIASEVAEEMEHYAETLNGKERFYGRSEAIIRIQTALGERGLKA